MRCKYCGTENPEESLFCVNCGKSISNSKNEKKKRKGCIWAGVIAFVVLCCVIAGIIIYVNGYDAGYSVNESGDDIGTSLQDDYPVNVLFQSGWVEHYILNGIQGCLFHLKFTMEGAPNHRIEVGYVIKDEMNKTVYEGVYPDTQTVPYQSTTWNDFVFLISYSDFKYSLSEGNHELRAYPFVYDLDTGVRYQFDNFWSVFQYYNEY